MEENNNVTSEQVLVWARRVEAQKAQSPILKNLNKTKGMARNKVQRQNGVQPQERLEHP